MNHSSTKPPTLTIGNGAEADLQVTDPDLTPIQAVAYLDDEGFVWVENRGTASQLQLKRSGDWLRVLKTNLCAGDRLKLGTSEVPVQELTRRLSVNRQARLKPVPSRLANKQINRRSRPGPETPGPLRNPITGKLQNRNH